MIKIETKFKKIFWTQHSEIKLKQYGLSKAKISSLIHKPERVEDGIVLGTTVMMKTNKVFNNSSFKKNLRLDLQVKTSPEKFTFANRNIKKAPGEVWVMYKDVTLRHGSGQEIRKIISCWRYPGVTKPTGRPLAQASLTPLGPQC
jgi:hypothetical protein